jgi:flagellar biosynthesis/type III secretory pathway chaperone
MDTQNLVDDLITITSRLVVVMGEEVERLRARRPRDIEELQEEKASLARAYETLIRELRKDPETLNGVAPALRAELMAATEKFQNTLIQNEASLRSAMEVNSRVLKAVADAVAESQKENAGYSRTGTLGKASKGGGRRAGPVTLDRTL